MSEAMGEDMVELPKLVTEKDEVQSTVLAEPHFTVSFWPWHNLLFWFILSQLDLPEGVGISPCRARMFFVPVHYTDLWKIRAPLHQVVTAVQ